MKTTVEISDALFRDARRYATQRQITFRELLESSLRKSLEEAPRGRKPFRLKKCAFQGQGMVQDYTWPEIRSRIYEGRGE